MVHALKIRTEYFEAVKKGTKTFETRFDDRGFAVGDYLALNEIDEDGKYTGNALMVEVTYILREPDFCKDGFAIMSISPCREASNIIEGIIISPTAPKMRYIPFSGFYEAVCPSCDEPLQTDTDHCEKCGQRIDWKIL